MADSPIKPEPVVTTGIPQSKLSGADIAQPYEMLGRALGNLGQAAEQVAVPLAERAGSQAVTRDDQGNIQVEHMPIFGLAGEAYERAVKVGALAEADGAAQRADIAMRQNFRDDPQGYLAAADKFKQDQVAKLTASAGPEVGASYSRVIDRTTTQTYRGLLNEKERLDLQRADNSITAQVNSASDDALALARQGVALNSPDMQGLLSKYTTLLDEKLKNPRLAYTQEQHDLDLQQFQGQVAGARNLYHVDQVYKTQGYQAATEAAKDVLTNADYKLTPAQRQAFYSHAMGEIRANEAIRHQDIGEARASLRELSTAATLGQKINPDEVEAVANGFRAANYPAGAAQVYATFAHKDLNDDHGRLPLRQQADDVNAIRAGAVYRPMIEGAAGRYGLDPMLLARQLNQESGFNPNSVSSAGARGIAQFMPATAARYGVNPADPASSIEGQARYMSDLTKMFGGNTGLALAGYNWGEGHVAQWMASGANPAAMPAETRRYVQAITGQRIEDWIAGKQPTAMGGPASPGLASFLLANRSATLDDSSTKAWKQVWEDWDSGKGGIPPKDKIDDIINAANATKNVDLLDKIDKGMSLIDYVERSKQLPIDQQVAIETELKRRLEAGAGGDGGALILKQLTARTTAIQNGLQNDPISTAVSNFPDKFKTPAPLNLQDPQQLVAGLKMRAQIAQTAAANWQTGPLSALDSQDVAQVKAALASPDPAAKAGIYGAIAQLPEDVRGATLRKLGGNEPQGMAEAAAGSLMARDPAIAASIFRGQAAMKADPRNDPEKEDEGKRVYHQDLDKELPASIFSVAGRTNPSGDYATMAAMVKARYADLQAQSGSTRYSSSNVTKAVNDVTGGVLSHNGGSLIAPARGMSQAQFDGVMLGITDDDLKGVTTLSGQPVTAAYLRGSPFSGGAQLESVGEGQYLVRLGSDPSRPIYAMRYAGTESPTPFVLDLRGRARAPLAMIGSPGNPF